MDTFLTSVLLLLVAFADAANKLPSSLQLCKQTDPDFNGCLKKAVQGAAVVLKNGLPTLGVLSIDPLHFTQIAIKDSTDRPVSLNLEFNEVDISGFSKVIVDSVEMKPGSYHMKAKLHFESPVQVTGPYKVDGKVLVVPVKGDGVSNITIPKLTANVELIGDPVDRDGDTYWDVKELKTDIVLDTLIIGLTGLYNNDEALAENTLKFLNENSREVAKELKPAIDEAISASFKEMAKRVFTMVPYKSVFLVS